MNRKHRQKYYVNRQEAVTIRCPACGRIGSFAVPSLRGGRHSLQVNCACGEIFAADFEFRCDFRIKTHIPATVRAISTPRVRARHCIVADQSNGGLLLRIDEEVPVKTEDRLIVRYRPQNEMAEEIERIIAVRHHLRGSRIGGAFVDPVQANSSVVH